MSAPAADLNRFELSASVVQVQSLRYTPAGIPAVNLVLEHESTVLELGKPRAVKLQIRAITFGDMALSLSGQDLGAAGRFEGFMVNARNGKGLVFHIQDFSKT